MSAWSELIVAQGGTKFLCVYNPDTQRNITNASAYGDASGVISVADYSIQALGYSSGFRARITAKRNGILHVGSTTYNMTSGQSLDVGISGYPSSAVQVSGWFE